MAGRYLLQVRRREALVRHVMAALAGNAHLSLEGNLSQVQDVFGIPGAETTETAELRRNTISPIPDFVVVPLEPSTVAPLAELLERTHALDDDVVHLQIEKDGRHMFGAYDKFHPSCVWWVEVDTTVLDSLKASGILESYEWWPR